jgi:hypothetical protein
MDAIILNIGTNTVLLTDKDTRWGSKFRTPVKRFAGGMSGI